MSWIDTFGASASSGAGGAGIGVAGALAVAVIGSDSVAEVTKNANVTITPITGATMPSAGDGSVTLLSDNASTSTVAALPVGTSGGTSIGVGASLAFNLVGTQSSAEIDDGATIAGGNMNDTGVGAVTLIADANHAAVTTARQGTSGGTLGLTPVGAISLVSDQTQATIGAIDGGLNAGGAVSVSATQVASESATASGKAAGGKADIGAAFAISLADDEVLATTSAGIDAGGAVTFAAAGSSLGSASATASAAGAAPASGSSSGSSSGGVAATITSLASGALGKLPAALTNLGPLKTLQGKLATAASMSGKMAATTENSISVAAAIGLDFTTSSVQAYVPSTVGVNAGGPLSVTAMANVGAISLADGSAVGTSAAATTTTTNGMTTTTGGNGGAAIGAAVALTLVDSVNNAELGFTPSGTAPATVNVAASGGTAATTAGTYAASGLTVTALNGTVAVETPEYAPSAVPPAAYTDVFSATAEAGAGGAGIGVAGALAIDAVGTSSTALVDNAATVKLSGGAVTIEAENEGTSTVIASPVGAGITGSKLGVGATVALNGMLQTSQASIGTGSVTGAGAVTVVATSIMSTDSEASGGAAGGTALDAVVAATVLHENTIATIASNATALNAAGPVLITATSGGTNTANAFGDTSAQGSSSGGGVAVGGSVAVITGAGLLAPVTTLLFGQTINDGITSQTVATLDRDVTTTGAGGSLTLNAFTEHTYVANSTAVAGGAAFANLSSDGGDLAGTGATAGNSAGQASNSASTYSNKVLSLDVLNLGDDISAAGDIYSAFNTAKGYVTTAQGQVSSIKADLQGFGGSNTSKLSAAAALGATITGDTVSAQILNSSGGTRKIALTGGLSVTANDDGNVQAVGDAASVQTSAQGAGSKIGLGIGAGLAFIDNATTASVASSTTVTTPGAVTLSATTTENTDTPFALEFTAVAMSGATGQQISVAGAVALAISTSTTEASLGDNVSIDPTVSSGPQTTAGALAVSATNTSELASRAWGGSLSTKGNGVGASVAAVVSNDTYSASIGANSNINAASVSVKAVNNLVDNPTAYVATLVADAQTDLSTDGDQLGASGTNKIGSNLLNDAKSLISTLGSDAAEDKLLGENNYYTEVIAGAASGSKVEIQGGFSLQFIDNDVSATVGRGAAINVTNGVTISASDQTAARALVGDLAATLGNVGVGVSSGIILDLSSVSAELQGQVAQPASGSQAAQPGVYSSITGGGAVTISSTASQDVGLFQASAALADETGLVGIVGAVVESVSSTASVAAGSTISVGGGAIAVGATNALTDLNIAGAVAIAGEQAVGGSLVTTVDLNGASATVASDANDKTTLTGGSIAVVAAGSNQFINVAVEGSASGTNAIGGAITPVVETGTVQASIGQDAAVTASAAATQTTTGVTVAATNSSQFVDVAGAVAVSGEAAVGGAGALAVVVDQTIASIGDGSSVDANGAVTVAAMNGERFLDAALGFAVAGETGLAGSITSSVVADTTQAFIGQGVVIGATLKPASVAVGAGDSTTIVDLAGAVGGAGETGLAGAGDINIISKNTDAFIGEDPNGPLPAGATLAQAAAAPTAATTIAAGDVVVDAQSVQNVYSLVAGLAIGGEVGAAGTISVDTALGSTLAAIATNDQVTARGNVAVVAGNTGEVDRLIGSAGLAGEVGLGAALGLDVIVQTTQAAIGAGATVLALGETNPLTETVGFTGIFVNPLAGVLDAALPGTTSASGLSGQLGTDSTPTTANAAFVEGGSLFILDRQAQPNTQTLQGVIVDATDAQASRTATAAGAIAGEVALALSGNVPIVITDTEASIGAGVSVNQGANNTAGLKQAVTVNASNDVYLLDAAGSAAGAGEVGVGAGADVAVVNTTTKASIGAGSLVAAGGDVTVTANASEDVANTAGAAAIGGQVGVAGNLVGFAVHDDTQATIASSANAKTTVIAGGNVVVAADDQTRTIDVVGTLGLGVTVAGAGAAIDAAVIVKTTTATIGDDATVTALAEGKNTFTGYTGANATGTAPEQGLIVQANSGESIVSINADGALGFFAGIAGLASAEIVVDTTQATIGSNARINVVGDVNAEAGRQNVLVNARDTTVIVGVDASAAGAFNVDPYNPISVGAAGAIDVEVVSNTTAAAILSGTTVNATGLVQVAAISNKVADSSADSIGAGIFAFAGALDLIAITNGVTPDQSSQLSSVGGTSYFDGQTSTGSGTILGGGGLGSSSDSNVTGAATMAQTEQSQYSIASAMYLQSPSSAIPSGTTATVQGATINAGGAFRVTTLDDVTASQYVNSFAVGISGAGGAAIIAVSATDAAAVEDASIVNAGSARITATTNHTYSSELTDVAAVGVAGAVVTIGDGSATTASVGDTSLANGDRTRITTAGTAIVAATSVTDVSSASAATLAVGGGAGVVVVALDPTTAATVASYATMTAGNLAAPATGVGSIVVQATSTESFSGADSGFTTGITGALTVYDLTGSTNAEVGSNASLLATGNVAVLANNTSTADLVDGTVAAGGAGASLGVSVANVTTTASIDASAMVTALGYDAALTYTSGYAASFEAYGANDTFNPTNTGPGVSVAANVAAAPTTTDAITAAGGDLLLEERVENPTIGSARGVIVSAASGNAIRSFAIGAGVISAGFSLDIPVVVSTTTATIGSNAQIDQSDVQQAAAAQSVTVSAASDFYVLTLPGSAQLGIGAGASATAYDGTTSATIGARAQVSAADDVAVSAAATEDYAGLAAAISAGGPTAGAASVLVLNDSTIASIGAAASVSAGNNVLVLASDETRVAAVAGSLGVSAVGAGGSLEVTSITKDTEATIGTGAIVNADAKGTDTFSEITGASFATPETAYGQGLLVEANNGNSLFTVVIAGQASVAGSVAGGINIQIVKDTTLASIDANASINTDGRGAANGAQDVNVTALDSTGIVSADGALGGAILAGLAGALDISVVENTTGASIGNGARVDATGTVYVNALTNEPIESTVASGALGAAALAGSLSVFYLGDGINPSDKAYAELDLSQANNPQQAANALLDPNSSMSLLKASSSAMQAAPASTTTAAVGSELSTDLGTSTTTAGLTAPTAAVAGTSATIGDASISAGQGVLVQSNDALAETTLAGAASASVFGASVGIAINDVSTTTTAQIGSTGATTVMTSRGVSVTAAASRSYDDTAFAGTLALAGGLEAAVAVATDASTANAQVENANVSAQGPVAVTGTLTRSADERAIGGGIAVLASAGASVASVTFGGQANAVVTATTIAAYNGIAPTSVLIGAGSSDSASAYAVAANAGIGAAAEGSAATVTVDPTVTASVIGGGIHSSGAVMIHAEADDALSAQALGVAVGGGLAIGISTADAMLGANVSASLLAQQVTVNGTAEMIVPDIQAGSVEVSTLVGIMPGASHAVSATSEAAVGGVLFGADGATATALNESSATTTLDAGLMFVALGRSGQNTGALVVTATSTTDQYAEATGIGAGGLLAVGAVTAEADARTTTTVELGAYVSAYVQGSFTLQATGADTDVANATAGNGGVLSGTGASASTTNNATVTATIDDATMNDDGSLNYALVTAQTITVGASHADTFFAGADTTEASALGASAAVAASEASVSPTVKIGIDALLIGDAYGSTSSAAVSIEAANTFNEQSGTASANAAAGGGINGTGASSVITLSGTSSVVIGAGAGLLAGTGATAGAMNIVADTTVNVADLVTLQTGGAIEGSGASSELDANLSNAVEIGSGANLLAFGRLDVGTYTFAVVSTSAYNSTSGLVDGGSATATTNLLTSQSVKVDANAIVEAYGELDLTPGNYAGAPGGATNIIAGSDAESFIKGLVAVPYADAVTSATSSADLNIASGALAQSLENIYVGAYPGTPTVTAYGRGNGFELGFIPTHDDHSTNDESTTSTFELNGAVNAGLIHEIDVTIAACPSSGCTAAQLTTQIKTLGQLISYPVPLVLAEQSDGSMLEIVLPNQTRPFGSPAVFSNAAGYTNAPVCGTSFFCGNFMPQQEAALYFPDVALSLDNGIAAGPVPAYEIGAVALSGGSVIINADKLTGTGSVTAAGSPILSVVNNANAYLIIDGVNVPDAEGGTIVFTGAVGALPATIRSNTVGGSGTPAINIENAYDGAPDSSGNGPGLFVVGAISNTTGSVALTNQTGSFASDSSIAAQQVSIYAPLGLVAYDNAAGTISAGSSVQSEYQNAVTFPGGYTTSTTSATDTSSADMALYYLGAVIYRDYANQPTGGSSTTVGNVTTYHYGVNTYVATKNSDGTTTYSTPIIDGAQVDQLYSSSQTTSNTLDIALYGVYGDAEYNQAPGFPTSGIQNVINNHAEILLGSCALYFSSCGLAQPSAYGGYTPPEAQSHDPGTVPSLSPLQVDFNVPLSYTVGSGANQTTISNAAAENTSGNVAGISAGQIVIKAAIVDIDAPIVVGLPTTYNITLGADLTQAIKTQTVVEGYILGFNPAFGVFTLTPNNVTITTGGAITQAQAAYKANTGSQFTDITGAVLADNPSLLAELPATPSGSTTSQKIFQVEYDALNHQVVLENLTASSGGGFAVIQGAIINTDDAGHGSITVQGGYGNVAITNSTGVALQVNNINTGSQTAAQALTSVVSIEDSLKPAASNTTTYVYTAAGGINEYVTSGGVLPVFSGANQTAVTANIKSNLVDNSSTYVATTAYAPEAGVRYDYAYYASLSRSVTITRNAASDVGDINYYTATAQPWAFDTYTAANGQTLNTGSPWLFYTASLPSNLTTLQQASFAATNIGGGSVSTTPLGAYTINTSQENTLLTEHIAGGVVNGASLNFGYTDGHFFSLEPSASDGSDRFTDYFATQAYLTLNISVKADFAIPITFKSNTIAGVIITSDAPVQLAGTITNPNGPTSISTSSGGITQTAAASILTDQLSLRSATNIGTAAQPIVATLTGTAMVQATSGTGNPAIVPAPIAALLGFPVGVPTTPGSADIALQLGSAAAIGNIAAGNATSGYGDVFIAAQGALSAGSNEMIAGNNITLSTTSGSIGTLATSLGGSSTRTNLLEIDPHPVTQLDGSITGGVVNVSAYGDLALYVRAPSLEAGLLRSVTGSVDIASTGPIYDASGQTSAGTLSSTQAAAAALNLYNPSATASITSFQNLVNADAAAYVQLLSQGSVTRGSAVTDPTYVSLYATDADQAAAANARANAAAVANQEFTQPTAAQVLAYASAENASNGTFVLSAQNLGAYTAKAAAALGLTPATVTPAQVQAYVDSLYQSYVNTLSLAYGANFQPAVSSAVATGTGFVVAPGSTLATSLTPVPFTADQLLAEVDRQALEPVQAVVGTGTPNIAGRTVTLTVASGGIGLLADPVSVTLSDLQAGTITTNQQSALAAATAPGSVTLTVKLANGQIASGYDLTDLPVGATVQGLNLDGQAPLFVGATGAFTASATSAVYLQATGALEASAATLRVAKIVTKSGEVSVLAPDSILSTGAASPTISTTGDISLVAGSGSVGSASAPITYQTSAALSYVSAGDSAYLESVGPTTSIGRVFAVNTASIDASAGDLTAFFASGVAVKAGTVDLDAQSSVGSSAAPFQVQVGANGTLNAQAGNLINVYAPTEAGEAAVPLQVGNVSALNSVKIGADADITIDGMVQSVAGAVSIASFGLASDPTTTLVMATTGAVQAATAITLTSPGTIVVGQLQLNGSSSGQAITIDSTEGSILSNGVQQTDIQIANRAGTVMLTAADDIGNATAPVSVDAPILVAQAGGDLGLQLSSQTDADERDRRRRGNHRGKRLSDGWIRNERGYADLAGGGADRAGHADLDRRRRRHDLDRLDHHGRDRRRLRLRQLRGLRQQHRPERHQPDPARSPCPRRSASSTGGWIRRRPASPRQAAAASSSTKGQRQPPSPRPAAWAGSASAR